MAGIAMPGILSQYSDRLGNVYGPDTLEANWYEDRLQRAAGVLKAPEGAATVLRSHEPDLSAQQKEITGSLAICPRTSRHPFMYQSRCVLSDGRNEKTSMSDTYFKPLAERPANPICSGGVESPYDAMLQQLTQHDSPKTRVSKDRMSNVQNEVRPVVDSEDKIKQRFITPRTLAHLYAERPSSQSGCRGFGAVVPRHEVGYAERLFSTTTRDALSTGLLPPATLSPHQKAPSSSMAVRSYTMPGGYEKATTNHTVFTFGFAKEANAMLPGIGPRENFGKTSLIKNFQIADNAKD